MPEDRPGEARASELHAGPYLLGVIGDPVAHSLSPALHQPALDSLRIRATYERWHTPAAELASRVESLRDPRVLGANVTVPHKLAAMRHVDEVSPLALRAGAVNTIVNRDGRLHGDNTDVYGFMASARDVLGDEVPAKTLVLGAGGAARAVVLALADMGVIDIVVANRDVDRAARLAAELAPAPVRAASLDSDALAQELPRCGLLVNATSLGWRPGEMPLAPSLLDLLPGDALVADLTYRNTDFLQAAASRMRPTLDGLAMLVHQGARAFELFTGLPAPLQVMFDAARQAQTDR